MSSCPPNTSAPLRNSSSTFQVLGEYARDDRQHMSRGQYVQDHRRVIGIGDRLLPPHRRSSSARCSTSRAPGGIGSRVYAPSRGTLPRLEHRITGMPAIPERVIGSGPAVPGS